jgi:hypothetical protein
LEIGSFIELDLRKGLEYFQGDDIARLNSGRAGIYHALKVLNCKSIYLPYYQCDTVREFLLKKNINLKYYSIDSDFNPINLIVEETAAVLFVNYYGIMSKERMVSLASKYKNVIIDNSQAFFAEPIENCLNVYSPRKFFGVPDGCYVIGKNAELYMEEYDQDYSSETAIFLLERIERGCESSYKSRMKNEMRVDNADILKMSPLTKAILDGIDYKQIQKKRRENFEIAEGIFKDLNKINATVYYESDCIPMVYPLVVESDGLLFEMQKNKIFQGHWWSYLLQEVSSKTFEYYLSRYIIPITIDQRYGFKELDLTNNIIINYINGE